MESRPSPYQGKLKGKRLRLQAKMSGHRSLLIDGKDDAIYAGARPNTVPVGYGFKKYDFQRV